MVASCSKSDWGLNKFNKFALICRSPEEADAQAVRVAVLLDELDFPGFDKPDPRTGHIIVEVKTPDAKELIEYSCSKRVIALPTGVLNARRYTFDISPTLQYM